MNPKHTEKRGEKTAKIQIAKMTPASHLTVIFIFFAFSVLFTYPLILHMNSHIPALSVYDPPLYVWNSWNFKTNLFASPHNPFIAPDLLYPFEPSLAYHDYTTARDIFVLILSPVLDTISAFNLVTLLMFTFSAYGAYLLTLRFVSNRFAAFLSGLIFSFCPFKLGRLLGHFNFIDSAFIPFYILFLYKTFEEKKIRNAVFMGLFLALIGYCSYYYLIFSVIFTLLFLLFYLTPDLKSFISRRTLNHRVNSILDSLTRLVALPTVFVIIYLLFVGYIHPPPISVSSMNKPVRILFAVIAVNFMFKYKFNCRVFIRGLGDNLKRVFGGTAIVKWLVSAAVFLVLFAPIFIPIISLRSDYMGSDVVGFKVVDYPSFEEFFRVSGLSSIKRLLTGVLAMNLEKMVSIGTAVLLLIAYSVIFIRKKTHIIFWYLTGGLFALFSLGHTLQVQGKLLLWMPYNILQSLPFFNGAINPSRFIIITMLSAGIVAAYSTEHIFHRLKYKKNITKAKRLVFLAGTLILMFIVLEYSTVPIFIYDLTPPAFYNKLAKDTGNYTVLELPFLIVGKARWIGGWVDRWGLFQYYQAVHGKRLLSGYLSYIPRDVITYYSKNEFIKDLVFLQDIKNPPDLKHKMIKRNKKFQTKKFMDLFDIRYIILHKQDLKGGSYEFLMAYLIKCLPEMEKVIDNDELTVYGLKPTKINVFYNRDLLDSRNDMMFIRGWSDYTERDGTGCRWIISKKSRIIFPSSVPEGYLMKISFRIPETQKTEDISFRLYLNKTLIGDFFTLSENSKSDNDSFEIYMPKNLVKKGSNLLDMEFGAKFNEKNGILVENLMIVKSPGME